MAAVLLVLGLVISACSGSSSDDDTVSIVVTTSILGDVVSSIVGEGAAVEVLVPIGADPHDYQASSRQVASVNDADLVLANGLGLEEGLEAVLDAAREDGVKVLELAPELQPIELSGSAALDPHVWLDPIRMAELSRMIGDEIELVAPESGVAERAEEYATELEAVHVETEALLADIAPGDAKLVTNHDSLGYFADRYGFEIVGTVIPSGPTLSEPSSQELADLVALMRSEGVNVVFADTSQPTDLAEAVAGELGEEVKVVELFTGSLGEPGTPSDSLVGLLLTNARLIATALGG